jgi:prophage regulatory protein
MLPAKFLKTEEAGNREFSKVLRRLMRLRAVEDATGMKKSQIYVAMERGVFPKPVDILEGGRAVGWVEDEIVSYLEARIALRDTRAAAAAGEQQTRRPRGRPRKTMAVGTEAQP